MLPAQGIAMRVSLEFARIAVRLIVQGIVVGGIGLEPATTLRVVGDVGLEPATTLRVVGDAGIEPATR